MTSSESSSRSLPELNGLPRDAAIEQFLSVCHSRRWAESMADSRPFTDTAQLQRTADSAWLGLGPDDWMEALEGHPRIGESGGTSREHSRQEQAGMREASGSVQAAIADGNRRYEDRFGHIFLISAAGGRPGGIPRGVTPPPDNRPQGEGRGGAGGARAG